jgi:S-adenosyl methyltransferase
MTCSEAASSCVDEARANQAFLCRVVRYLAGRRGVRQFVDIGCGLPAPGSTHEVAQAIAPQCRVVYVDNDMAALSHAHALQASTPEGAYTYVDADLRDPETLLAKAAKTLDLTRPVPAGIIARSHAQVTALFGGLSLVAPGVVPVAEWRRDVCDPPGQAADLYAGLLVTGGRRVR